MPRTDQQNEAIRAETRARIAEAALALFGERGYEATSVRAIAERAGVAQGLLYSYYEGKEQLLQAIFRQSMADVRESFALAEAAPPEQRVEALIQAAFAIVRRNQSFWRLSYGARMQPAVLGALGDDIRDWAGQIVETLVGYFRAAGAPGPEVEAAILFALIDGVSQHYVLDPQRYPLDAVAAAIVAKYRPAKEHL